MGSETYRVLFKGELTEGAVIDDVKKKLASLFKTDIQKIDRLFTGQVKTIKKNAALAGCQKIEQALTRAGAKCYIEKEEGTSANTVERTSADTPEREPIPRPQPQNHLSPTRTVPPGPGKHCSNCGSRLAPTAMVCTDCGTKAHTPVNKTALLLLTFFMGGLGAHKFYIGKYVQGVFYLLFCWTLIPSLIALVEFIVYAVTDTAKLQRKYEAKGHIAIIIVVLGVCMFVGIAILGILAAIAVPNFFAYRQKALKITVERELTDLKDAQDEFLTQNGRYAVSLDELEFVATTPGIIIHITGADDTCFEAVGTGNELQEDIVIDCQGLREQAPSP